MKKSKKKLINRSINRIYKHFPSPVFRLFLMNLCTKMIQQNNKIEYDKMEDLYWLKSKNTYLFAVDIPYFDFNKEKINTIYQEIFCPYYKPKRGDVILDLGAGIGTELNYFMGKIKAEGTYYGIEASPRCFRKLELLKNKNAYKNCLNHNVAISGRNGKIWMEEQDDYLINQINDQSKGVEIFCNTLDDFIREKEISRISFLKVNIEGAEYDMVDGMQKSIEIIENLAISCHDFLTKSEDEKIKNKIVKFLMKNNFEIYSKETGNKVLDSWIYGKKIINRIPRGSASGVA